MRVYVCNDRTSTPPMLHVCGANLMHFIKNMADILEVRNIYVCVYECIRMRVAVRDGA